MALNFNAGVPKQGMMEIGIALVLHDRFSNQAGAASREIRQLQRDARSAVVANLNAVASLGQMGLGAFRALSGHMVEMINYGAEFIDTMTTVKAITQSSVASMDQLNELAMSLGKRTMFSSQDVASGMKYLAMAGNKAEDIQAMIQGATYAAGATGMALGGKGGAADVITNVMKTFQLSGKEMAMWVGDVMTNATLSANISMNDLAASIRYAAADMTNLGYELPEVAAAIGTLGNMGIQGSMAGTALANMVRYLGKSVSDPSFKGNKLLTQLGITRSDLVKPTGQLKSLADIMNTISRAMANMDDVQKNMYTTGIFGVRGNRAATALLRDLDNFTALYQKVDSTKAGFAESIVAERMSTLAGQLNAMKSTWENFKASFVKAMAPVLIPVFKGLTVIFDTMRKILSTKLIGPFIAGWVLIGGVVMGIVSKFLVLRTTLLTFQTDTTVTAKNMFAVLAGGWKAATIAAADYAKMQGLINAQTAAGVLGKPGAIAMSQGYAVNNIKSRTITTKTGRTYTQFYDATTGRMVSRSAANAAINAGAGAVTAGVVGRGLMSAGKIGTGLLKLGKGIFRFLGGWWGLAITAALTIIPPLISKLTGKSEDNANAIDENTSAINGLREEEKKRREEEANNKLKEDNEKLTGLVNLLSRMVENQGGPKVEIILKSPNGTSTSTQVPIFNTDDYEVEETGLGN